MKFQIGVFGTRGNSLSGTTCARHSSSSQYSSTGTSPSWSGESEEEDRFAGLVSTLNPASQRTSAEKLTGERGVSVQSGQKFLRFCGRLVPQTVKVLLALDTFYPFHRRADARRAWHDGQRLLYHSP